MGALLTKIVDDYLDTILKEFSQVTNFFTNVLEKIKEMVEIAWNNIIRFTQIYGKTMFTSLLIISMLTISIIVELNHKDKATGITKGEELTKPLKDVASAAGTGVGNLVNTASKII
jgi:hypothetical protein